MSSVTAEPETRPSARTRITNWLNKAFSLSVSEDDPELIKKARAFGTDAFGRRDFETSPLGFETAFRSKKLKSYLRGHSTENSASAIG